MYVYVYAYVCVCMCTFVHVCVCMCMYVYVCVCMGMYMYVYVYVYVCEYVHVFSIFQDSELPTHLIKSKNMHIRHHECHPAFAPAMPTSSPSGSSSTSFSNCIEQLHQELLSKFLRHRGAISLGLIQFRLQGLADLCEFGAMPPLVQCRHMCPLASGLVASSHLKARIGFLRGSCCFGLDEGDRAPLFLGDRALGLRRTRGSSLALPTMNHSGLASPGVQEGGLGGLGLRCKWPCRCLCRWREVGEVNVGHHRETLIVDLHLEVLVLAPRCVWPRVWPTLLGVVHCLFIVSARNPILEKFAKATRHANINLLMDG